METKTYKIVFSGDLAFDTDADEVSAALAEKCRYPQPVIDKILNSKKITIKKGLSSEDALRYKSFFDRLGLMCDMVSEQEVQQIPPLLQQETVAKPQAAGRTCPKCGASGQLEGTCLNCGIIFERFENVRTRNYEYDMSPQDIIEPTITGDPLWQRLVQHPGIQTLIMLAVIFLIRGPLHNLYLLAIAMGSVGVIAYFLFQASETGDSALDLCSSHIALWPQKLERDETISRDRSLWPIIPTYSQIILFYLFLLFLPGKLATLSFFPAEKSTLVTIINFFLAPLIHTDNQHLWPNMTILWLLISHMEQCSTRQKLSYLCAATLLPQGLYTLLTLSLGQTPHVVGSSALIASLLGTIIAVQPRAFITGSLPLISPLSALTRISVKVEIQPLVLTGLFFLFAVGGNLPQVKISDSQDLLYPLSGLVCGLVAGYLHVLRSKKTKQKK